MALFYRGDFEASLSCFEAADAMQSSFESKRGMIMVRFEQSRQFDEAIQGLQSLLLEPLSLLEQATVYLDPSTIGFAKQD